MINLKDILTKYPECKSNSQKLKGILVDLYPQEKLYANILGSFIDDGIVAEMEKTVTIDALKLSHWNKQLEDKHGYAQKYIDGCVNIWAEALGVTIKRVEKPKIVAIERPAVTNKPLDDTLHVHKYKTTKVPPTCTEKGYTLHTCDCGYEYSDNYVKPQHNYVLVEYCEPTCENDGKEVYQCSECGETKENTMTAFGHKFGTWIEQKRPTCTEQGLEARQCEHCGKVETKNTNKLGHEFGEWRIEGDYKIRDCSQCGKEERINWKAEEEEKQRQEQEHLQKWQQEQKIETEIIFLLSLGVLTSLVMLFIPGDSWLLILPALVTIAGLVACVVAIDKYWLPNGNGILDTIVWWAFPIMMFLFFGTIFNHDFFGAPPWVSFACGFGSLLLPIAPYAIGAKRLYDKGEKVGCLYHLVGICSCLTCMIIYKF